MNVNTWFEFHARRPIRYILWLFLALNIAFLVYTYVIGSENQYKSFKNNTISPLLISLQNNDRVLMEYSLEYSIENLGAKEIYLCQDDIVIASPSRDIYSCSDIKTNNFFEELTTFSLPSFQGYKVYIVSSIWPFEVKDLWFLPLSLIIFFLVSWVVNNLQKRIAIDILGSVEKIFEGNEKIDIDEFELFRQKFISSQEKSNKHKKTKKESKAARALFHNLNNQIGILEGLRKAIPMSERQERLFSNTIFEMKKMSDKSRISLGTEAIGDLCIADILPIISNLVQNKELVANNSGKDISIELENKTNLNSLFCKINATEFRSIIGNLINNSLEAYADKIVITTRVDDNGFFNIEIADNGKGVPVELRHKLFEENFSDGKEKGSGIGLSHAKKYLETWGGKIYLHPNQNTRGSIFVLSLRAFEVPEISICSSTRLLVLDDDNNDRKRLIKKIYEQLPNNYEENVLEFQDYDQLSEYLDKNKEEKKILFSDYDLGLIGRTGVDLIRTFSLEHLSFLVTNSYDSEALVKQCSDANISIIPKPKIENIKINFVS